jgi:hypothetical protein
MDTNNTDASTQGDDGDSTGEIGIREQAFKMVGTSPSPTVFEVATNLGVTRSQAFGLLTWLKDGNTGTRRRVPFSGPQKPVYIATRRNGARHEYYIPESAEDIEYASLVSNRRSRTELERRERMLAADCVRLPDNRALRLVHRQFARAIDALSDVIEQQEIDLNIESS